MSTSPKQLQRMPVQCQLSGKHAALCLVLLVSLYDQVLQTW